MRLKRGEEPMAKRRSHQWKQGVWTARDQLVLLSILLWQALARGTDFIQGIAPQSADYILWYDAFGQWGIGLMFIIPACMVIIGMTFRNGHGIAWLGHALLGAIYTALGGTILVLLWIAWWPWWTILFTILVAVVTVVALKKNTPETRAHPYAILALLAAAIVTMTIIPEINTRGLRAPGFYVSMGLCHFLWAVRMGVTPLNDPDEAEEVVAR